MEMNIYFAGGCFWGTEHYISQFMGVTVPEVRRVAKRFRNCSFDLLEALLESEWHECRLCALLILREKYAKSPDEAVTFYLTHTDGINNLLIDSKHDLMQKAVGWMLREVGKKDESFLPEFLDRYCMIMPRTMLRYSIEKLSSDLRETYMKGLSRYR